MTTHRGDDLESVWLDPSGARTAPDVGRLAAGARRGTLRLRLVVVGEILVTIALILLTAEVARRGIALFEAVWLAGAWLAWAVAVRFVVANRRGVWSAIGNTTADFLALARERARRKLKMVRFTLQLLAFQVVLFLGLFAWGRFDGRLAAEGRIDLAPLVVISAAYVGWAIWYRRRALAELETAQSLLREIGTEAGADPDIR